jgi:hypothetical protein
MLGWHCEHSQISIELHTKALKVVMNLAEKLTEYSEKEYLNIVKEMVEQVKYGQIVIVVQDGKVVQIEQNKKIRLKN